MNSHPRKKLFDYNGVLIKENDTVKVSKIIGGAILLRAKYDEETKRWLFYTGDIVACTWEDLHLSQVKSIVVVSDEIKKK